MADYCMQCSGQLFGGPTNDLSGLSTPENTMDGLFPIVLCEGCGTIQVDHTGRCVSPDCLEHGHSDVKE